MHASGINKSFDIVAVKGHCTTNIGLANSNVKMATSTTLFCVALLFIAHCFAAEKHFKDGEKVKSKSKKMVDVSLSNENYA